jgi:hypothetical protein
MNRVASLRTLFGRSRPGVGVLLGGVLVLGAFFPREPTRADLRLVEGDVKSAQVVNDWYGRPKRIDFRLRDSAVRYWTDRVVSELAASDHSASPVHLKFYAEFRGEEPKTSLLGSVKTYGLSVNNREVISVDHYLAGESALRTYVMLPFGGLVLLLSVGSWLYRRKPERNVA